MFKRNLSLILKIWANRNLFPILLLCIITLISFSELVEGAGQLLCDPGFEDSSANGNFPSSGCWKPSSAGGDAYAIVTTTAARSGNNGLWIYTGNSGSAYWSRPYQEFTASARQKYYGSAWIRSPSGYGWVEGSLASVRIEFLDDSRNELAGGVNSSGITTSNSDWEQYSRTSESAPTETAYVRFICNIEKPNGDSGISIANFDDTFFATSGIQRSETQRKG